MQNDRIARRRSVLVAVLAMFLLLSGATYAGINATAAKPDIQFQISPASQSVQRGQPAAYTVTLTSIGGFAGSVGLSVTGLPSGSTATLSPVALTLSAAGSTSSLSSILNVTTSLATPLGSSTLKVTGTSGKVSGSITAGLTVNALPTSALSMTTTPATVTLAPGETAAYTMQLLRTSMTSSVSFAVTSGLPLGAIVTFAPSTTLGDSSILQVTTLETTKDDTYTLNVVAASPVAGGLTASSSVKLVVLTKGKNFAISGSVTGLAPGLTQPLALSLTNPNKKPLSVTNLSVTLQGVTKAARAPGGPCNLSDYAVVQYSGPYPLVLPGSSTSTLSALGVASGQRPQIQLINKPGPSAANNQDGCKGATLSLSYSGSAQGN